MHEEGRKDKERHQRKLKYKCSVPSNASGTKEKYITHLRALLTLPGASAPGEGGRMTTQEAIKYFKKNNERIRSTAIDENRTSKFMKETIDANNMAIRSLEADRKIENVLYDIRNKITMLFIFDREQVVEIIDKYIKEVEDEDKTG